MRRTTRYEAFSVHEGARLFCFGGSDRASGGDIGEVALINDLLTQGEVVRAKPDWVVLLSLLVEFAC